MTETNIKVYEMSHTSGVKLDYFLCSLAVALFAYIAQTYTPQKLDNFFSIVQTVSLLILAISFYAGIKRIQFHNATLRYNHKMLHESEQAKKYAIILNSNETTFTNAATGKTESRKEIEKYKSDHIENSTQYENLARQADGKCASYGKIQLYFLFLGFLSIFFSKILQPYETDLSQHTQSDNRAVVTLTNKVH